MSPRSILGVACAIGALAVAGCGSDDDGGSTGSSGASGGGGDAGYTVAFIPGCTCDPYYSTETAGFEEEAEKLGVEAIVQGGANFDPGDQVPVLQAVIQKKPDLIVIDPTDQQALVAPIKLATEQGIPVITTGNEISADLAVSKIAASSIEGGREAGKFVQEQAGDAAGPVLVNNTEPGVSSVADRDKGFREVLEGSSSLELLPTQYNNDDQAKAASITSSTLRSHPDLVAVFATNVLSAQGVASALRGAGQAGKDVIAVGYDASEEQIHALRDGLLDAVISQDPRRIGALAVQTAVKHLDGETVPKDQPLKPIVITRENVDDPEIQKTIYR